MLLTLYRGLGSESFEILSSKEFKKSREIWGKILINRAKGNFKYPHELDSQIQDLSFIARLENQYFTDNKKIALAYAKSKKGILLELKVPLADVLKHFRLEFQNFGARKKNFEIVYVVKSAQLAKSQKKWRLRCLKQ